jgi:hypothetical protein
VKINEAGRLAVTTPAGSFEDDAPVAFQEIDGKRIPVPLAYRMAEDHSACGKTEDTGAVSPSGSAARNGQADSNPFTYGFNIGRYDATQPLILDPAVLVYCGYVGGSAAEDVRGIAVDSAGNAYIAGMTTSSSAGFPVVVGPDLSPNGGYEMFVAKVKADGTGLVYCGYIGGSAEDTGWAIAVDGSGSAYVTGQTYSDETTFPVAVGPSLTGYQEDAFVAKVKADGSGLVYCGFIGGYQFEYGDAIAVDAAGAAYVVGTTESTEAQDFPVTVGPDLTFNGTQDAYIAKVKPDGTSLVYCGYIGGAADDGAADVTVDAAGNAYVGGTTESDETTFPVKIGPDLTINNTAGYQDGFVAKVKADGTGLVYCGYIGGAGNDGVGGIALNSSGCLHVCGGTNSSEATFPVSGGPDLTYNGGIDAFIAKVRADSKGLIYCGYIGGSALDGAAGIAVDGSGNAYVMGQTSSTEATFPVTVGPGLSWNGHTDAFVAKVSFWDSWAPKHAVGDFDGDGAKEVAVDFGANGIYLYNNGSWSQISSANPEGLLAGDFDGDNSDEIMADFGSTGLWLWNAGAWSKISSLNPD